MFNALRLLLVGAAIGFLVGLVVNERKHRRSMDIILNDPDAQEFIEQSMNDPKVRLYKAMEDALSHEG